MSTGALRSVPVAARVASWAGCVLGAAIGLLFVAFAIGEGLPPLAEMNASFAALGVLFAGFVLMWWKDWLGGVVSLAGIGAFYALEFAANGHAPGGWVFPLCFVPGLLALAGKLIRSSAGPKA